MPMQHAWELARRKWARTLRRWTHSGRGWEFVWVLLPLLMLAVACGGKRNVRVPAYWPEASNSGNTPSPAVVDDRVASANDSTSTAVPAIPVPAPPAPDPGTRLSRDMEGLASWYGDPYHGKTTANGEVYDMFGMTAAHRTLPFDTRVRVTHLNTNKQVVVRINDRGPFVGGRVIDLSKEAATQLGMLREGIAPVRLETIAAHGVVPQRAATYTVQVGYFRESRNAVSLFGRLNEKYDDVAVVPLKEGGFRVQVGKKKTHAEAEQLVVQLRKDDLKGFIRIL